METIYFNARLRTRNVHKVVDLESYRQRRALVLDGTVLPDAVLNAQAELTPELPEPALTPIQRFTFWADAVCSLILIVGALLVLAAVL